MIAPPATPSSASIPASTSMRATSRSSLKRSQAAPPDRRGPRTAARRSGIELVVVGPRDEVAQPLEQAVAAAPESQERDRADEQSPEQGHEDDGGRREPERIRDRAPEGRRGLQRERRARVRRRRRLLAADADLERHALVRAGEGAVAEQVLAAERRAEPVEDAGERLRRGRERVVAAGGGRQRLERPGPVRAGLQPDGEDAHAGAAGRRDDVAQGRRSSTCPRRRRAARPSRRRSAPCAACRRRRARLRGWPSRSRAAGPTTARRRSRPGPRSAAAR